MRSAPATLLTLILATTNLPSAAAQDEDIVAHREGDDEDKSTFEIYAEYGFGTSKEDDAGNSYFVGTPLLALNYWFPDSPLELGVKWGLVHLSSSGMSEDSYFAFGNPYVSGHFNVEGTFGMFDIGLGVGIPLASLSDDDPIDAFSSALAYGGAIGIHGWWDFWLYTPDQLSLVIPARIEFDIPGVFVAASAAGALMIATGDNDTEFGLQLGAEAGLNLGPLDIGIRAQWGWIPTSDADQNFQFAFGPLARLNFDAIFFSARFIMNVGGPSGTSFVDDGAVYGAHLGAGLNL